MTKRIGVAKGKFELPDARDYPRDTEWENMPDVGQEDWPMYQEGIQMAA